LSKSGLTIEEHKNYGQFLTSVSAGLVRLVVDASFAEGTTSRAYKAADKANIAIQHLRSELEEVMVARYPQQPEREALDVYYPTSDEAWERHVKECFGRGERS
jgi:hypothetical protein